MGRGLVKVRRNRARATGRRESGTFIRLPHEAWRSPAFAALSAQALKLLIDIAGRYNGRNNGNLEATWTILSRERGWKSRDTLHKALGELVQAGFLFRTRQGRRLCGKHEPSLYAVTWWAIDASDKHQHSSTTALRLWRTKRANASTPAVPVESHQARLAVLVEGTDR